MSRSGQINIITDNAAEKSLRPSMGMGIAANTPNVCNNTIPMIDSPAFFRYSYFSWKKSSKNSNSTGW
jgi:hypothetical protein